MKNYKSQFYLLPYVLIIVALVALVGNCKAQDVTVNNGKLTFERIYRYDSLSDEALFKKTKAWFVENFRSANNVISGESQPTMIKGTFFASYTTTLGNVLQDYYNDLEIRIKTGAIKFTVTNLRNTTYGWGVEQITVKDGQLKTSSIAVKGINDIKVKSNAMAESLNTFILKDSAEW